MARPWWIVLVVVLAAAGRHVSICTTLKSTELWG